MNFLSHHFLVRHHPSGIFRAANVLPDLLRVSNPSLKIFGSRNLLADSSPQEMAIRDGILNHFKTDRLFHDLPVFRIHVERLKKSLKTVFEDHRGTRLFFLSHILVEMILDRIILKEDLILGENFYHDLKMLDEQWVHTSMAGFQKYDGRQFSYHLKRFIESEYLFSYREDEALFYAVNRIHKSVGMAGFNRHDFKNFQIALLETEGHMKESFHSFWNLE